MRGTVNSAEGQPCDVDDEKLEDEGSKEEMKTKSTEEQASIVLVLDSEVDMCHDMTTPHYTHLYSTLYDSVLILLH